MKILFLSHKFYPDLGGIEVNSEILATSFHHFGHEVKLLTWTKETGGKEFPFEVIRNPSFLTLFSTFIWSEIIFENNPCMRLAWPNLIFNKPDVVALRTWVNRMDGRLAWQDKLKFLWLKRSASVIAISHSVRNKSWKAATVIGNPYRADLFRPNPAIQQDVHFAFLGRLVSDKGADMAIKAVNEIVKNFNSPLGQFSKVKLSIIGEGPELSNLKSLVQQLDLTENVNFVGPLRDKALVSFLNRHKYLLVPSVWEEPFGNVALEGMACGCLPIVSDGGGLPDAIGNAGISFVRNDLNDFVRTIKLILGNHELETQIRNNAPLHLSKHHPDLVSRKYLDILELAFSKYKK